MKWEKHERTANNDILCPVLNLSAAIGMHNCQIARMQSPACEELPRGFGVLVVSLDTYVAEEDDFADLLAVSRNVDEDSFWLVRFYYTDRETRDEPVSLPSHFIELFFRREIVPLRQGIAFRDRTVRFCQAVDMCRPQIQIGLFSHVSSIVRS